MHNYNLYLTSRIGNKQIQDHIQIASKEKIKEFRIKEYKTNNEIKTEIKCIKESDDPTFNILDQQLRDTYQQLSPEDQKNLIENGIITEDEAKYQNMDIFYINK